jgi:hypothetical protein
MDILTLPSVIALEKGDQISGMAGVVSQVMAVKEEVVGRPKQIVKISDGPHEVLVSIECPADCGGVLTKDLIGKRVYFWPEADEHGKVKGLRRGQSTPSTYKPGTTTHWINLSYPGKWGKQDKSNDPGMVQPDAEDDLPFDVLPEKEAEKPAPVQSTTVAKASEEFSKAIAEPPKDKTIQVAPDTTIPRALALIVLQHRQCVEAALDTAKALHDQFEEVTGGACNEQAIATMAHTIFAEARKSGVWK